MELCANLPVVACPLTVAFDVEGYSSPIRLTFVSDACHVFVRPPFRPGFPYLLRGCSHDHVRLNVYYSTEQMQRLMEHATAMTVHNRFLSSVSDDDDDERN